MDATGKARKTSRTVTFEIDEGCVVVSGVAVVATLDGEGKRGVRLVELGDATETEMMGMLHAGLDRVRSRMARLWA